MRELDTCLDWLWVRNFGTLKEISRGTAGWTEGQAEDDNTRKKHDLSCFGRDCGAS